MSENIEYLLLTILLLFGCSSHQAVQRKIVQNDLYTKKGFNPQLYVYHYKEDSSRVFFNIEPEEVLFARSNPESAFQANIKLEVLVYQFNEKKKVFVDTFSLKKKFTNEPSKKITVNGELNIPLSGKEDYLLKILCYDENKNVGKEFNFDVPKSNLNHRMNFLVLDDSTHFPIYDYQKIGSGGVSVENARNGNSKLSIFEIDLSQVKFPPPPFASRKVELPLLPDNSVNTLFFKQNYLYFITTDEDKQQGIAIAVRNSFYPQVQTYMQMVLPTRYITTRSEYEELTSGIHTKESLDDFWLKCGGSKERAKQLIDVYYSRVELANKFFSAINPGWKTDRGTIFIIYGRPNDIQLKYKQEIWIYGDVSNPNSLSFVFDRKDNMYSNNCFELQRNSGYRIHWQRAVTNWINGRVYERK